VWRFVAIRLTLALLGSATLALTFASAIVSGIAPVIELLTEGVQPDKAVHVAMSSAKRQDGAQAVDVRTFLLKPLHLGNGVHLRSGSWLPITSLDADHLLVPAVIVWTVVLGWPVPDLRRRAWSLAFGLIASFGVTVGAAALLIAGKIDILVIQGAEQVKVQIPETALVWTAMLLEVGGIWVIAATISVFWMTALSSPRVVQTQGVYPEPLRG
jgi:hypothetical protein